MNFTTIDWKRWGPALIAVAIGFSGMIYYVSSGRGNLDLNTRELEKSANVEQTLSTSRNIITVKCKNGENYQIMYKEGQTNFEDLVYNKCGPEGMVSS